MNYKNNVIVFFIGISINFLIFIIFLFLYDPLHLFKKPVVFKDSFHQNMREQGAGIINNWKFDSIILGTSALENTSSKEASKILGGQYANISLSGSDFFERKVILDYALKSKQIKKVIYSLDHSSLYDSRESEKSNHIDKYRFLYDDSRLNDFKAYLNDKYLNVECIVDLKCFGKKTDFDMPNSWYDSKKFKFGGVDKWFSGWKPGVVRYITPIINTIDKINEGQVNIDKDVELKIKKSKFYLEENLLQVVKNNPDTDFIFVVPPYSRLNNAINAQYNKSVFKHIKESIKYLVIQDKKYKNLKVFAFDNFDFTANLKFYKDLGHYDKKINSLMLDYISKEVGILNSQNIDKYLEEFTSLSLNYDLKSIGNILKEHLKNIDSLINKNSK